MNPLKLSLRNLGSWERLEFDFPDGLTSIVGEVRDADEGVSSNGAGKSTIALAVDVALFGPEGRESLSQYQTHGTEGMSVELEFEHRGSTFRVRRAVSPQGKATADFEERASLVDGWLPDCAASIKETNQAIEATLGMTRATFRASSLLLQGMVAFPELEPRERSGMLFQMLGLERWEKRQALVRVEKTEVERRVYGLDDILVDADEDLATLEDAQGIAENATWAEAEAKHILERDEQALEKHTEAYREMNEQVQARRLAMSEREAAEARLAPLERRSEASREAFDQMPALKARFDELLGLVKQGEEIIAEGALLAVKAREWEKRTSLIARSEEIKTKLEVLRRDKGASCELCGQALEDESRRRTIAKYESDWVLTMTELGPLAAAEDPGSPKQIPDEVRNAPAELGAAQERLTRLVDTVEQAPALAELAAAREAVEQATKQLTRLPSPDAEELQLVQQGGLEARARVNESKEAVRVASEQAVRARVEVERLEKLDETTREKRAERDELLAELDVLAIFDKAYGRDGLPARYLETVVLPHVEASASRILTRMGAGCRVRFNTVREGKTSTRDELYVEIVWDNGDVQEYRHFSGGEKTRIGLAIALALAEFLAGRDRASDLLVVDEPQYLDAAGMEAIVEVLHDLNRRVPKVMLIAHDPRLSEAFDQSVRVIREGGRSRLASAEALVEA